MLSIILVGQIEIKLCTHVLVNNYIWFQYFQSTNSSLFGLCNVLSVSTGALVHCPYMLCQPVQDQQKRRFWKWRVKQRS